MGIADGWGERVARAEVAYRACRLCPRDCGVDRIASSDGAFCRLGEHAFVYKELLSRGEEAVLDPTWLVDLGGCSLRCLFCTEWAHVIDPQLRGVRLDPAWFVPRLRQRKAQGARTLSLVGGDPTVSLLGVLRALAQVPEADWLPVVWNCNGLLTDEARGLLRGVVASWVIDLKFGNSLCAQRLAGVPAGAIDAFAEVTKSLEFALHAERRAEDRYLPPLIVRHLVMPGHLECCTRPVLTWLAANYPKVPVNLMTVYLPSGPAARGLVDVPELAEIAGQAEVQAALRIARETTPVLWLDGKM
jgi:putative pyruvate formate lyase activating enzyme